MYVDNSHSPYRLLRLARRVADAVYPVHLIRDPRGVVLSMMTNSGFSAADAIRAWLRHQQDVMRIYRLLGDTRIVRYEALCLTPNEILAELHRWAGLPVEHYSGDFKTKEHHILGNRMRNTSSEIKLDERWRRDLGRAERDLVENHLQTFLGKNPQSPLNEIIETYLDDVFHHAPST